MVRPMVGLCLILPEFALDPGGLRDILADHEYETNRKNVRRADGPVLLWNRCRRWRGLVFGF